MVVNQNHLPGQSNPAPDAVDLTDDYNKRTDKSFGNTPARDAKKQKRQAKDRFKSPTGMGSIPAVFEPLFRIITNQDTTYRYVIMRGGRGSGKSTAACMALAWLAANHKVRILMAREFQNSMDDSSYAAMIDAIYMMGLEDKFIITPRSITGTNGSAFIWKGLSHMNINAVRSLQNIDVCFIEEAHAISKVSWDILEPTIRGGSHFSQSLFIACYNPTFDEDPINWEFTGERLLQYDDDEVEIITANYWHNPFLITKLRKRADKMKELDPFKQAHVYGGKTTLATDDNVMKRWRVRNMDYMIKPDMMPMFGCDFGHSASPTVLLRIWFLENKCFYIDYEAVEYNIKLSDMPSLFAGTHPEGLWNNDNYYKGIPESRKHTIICDNARPETWQMLKDDYGFQTEPCDKHSTSVIDGIEFLNSYQTYIHPRCVHTQKDFIGFKFKRDPKTERVTRVLIDEYKDAPDAFRYGTEHLRKKIMGDRKIGEGNTDFLLP